MNNLFVSQIVRRGLAWGWHDMCGRLGFHKLQKPGACRVLQAAFGILSGCPLVPLVPPLRELHADGLSKQAGSPCEMLQVLDEVGEGS